MLLIRDDIDEISIYPDKPWVTMRGSSFDAESKLGNFRKSKHYGDNGRVLISCKTTPGRYVKFMAKAVEGTKSSAKKLVGSMKGRYEAKSYPLSKDAPIIQLGSCTLIEPKK